MEIPDAVFRRCLHNLAFLPVLGSTLCCAGQTSATPALLLPDTIPTGVALPDPNLVLDLKLRLDAKQSNPTHAPVVSPVFRAYIQPSATISYDKDDEVIGINSLMQMLGLDSNNAMSMMCVIRTGNSPGAGVRWSINDGFGFYVQGKSFMQLKRLISSKEVNFCPPGDSSLTCRSLPRRVCE